ncbi:MULTISPECIES: glutamic-type intramembrane protease PrsW [unclassified Exiguobacterium]|uniref:glutamic-type intramembrane protease PrsW n=1 Tax=unclassified Exiguobacterium TaxID=2644629 RepID=UPI001BE94DDE|nr:MULTISPECIES: glutamic-type intramembrane protease PrsW [unclassified Exiguobacterium]MDE0562780.1 glutamic-type intramembrane protease PrsW [Exiguobacterium sp. B2(2022)]
MIAIALSAVAPGLALLSYFYLRHELEAEPLGYVIRSFVAGAVLVFPIMFIQYAFVEEGVLTGPFWQAYVTTALLEEFFKWFMIYYTIYIHKVFDDYYDGILYAVACSLGFATLENFLYLWVYDSLEIAIWRAILPVSGHALFAVVMGYCLGRAKHSARERVWLFMAIFSATVIHGTFDLILILEPNHKLPAVLYIVILWMVALLLVRAANLSNRRQFK